MIARFLGDAECQADAFAVAEAKAAIVVVFFQVEILGGLEQKTMGRPLLSHVPRCRVISKSMTAKFSIIGLLL